VSATTENTQAARSPLWRLMPLINAHKWRFWGGMSLINLGRLLEAFMPLLLKLAIDRIEAGVAALAMPALGILGLMVARYWAFNFGRRYVREVGVEAAFELRQRLYWHLQFLGPKFFAGITTGDLMARAINDVQLIRMLIGLGTRLVFVLGFSGIIALIFMSFQSWQLTLMLLPVMPFIAYAGWVLSKRIFDQSMIVQEGFSTLSSQVQENLNGIRTIQTHAQEEREIDRFTDVSSAYANDYFRLMFLNSALTSTMLAMTGVATLVILGFGGYQVIEGTITVGTFTAFIFYLAMMLAPIREAGIMVTLFQRGASASARIFEILDQVPEIRDAEDAKPLEKVGGSLKIQNLSFRHPGKPQDGKPESATADGSGATAQGWPALNDVSLDIEAGEMIAILGRVGSGKSTLLRLLVRLLDPPPGTIYLDGRDIRMLPIAQVRGQIALVPQDPFLFAATLDHNISYDNPLREEGPIWRAAQAADLEGTIERFPDRLDTVVGERGVTLSGGQKQRTSLARGLIRETPVLLLDDCFSSVDTETEEAILSRLKELRAGRTTLMVSHRVSTARHATRILMLEEGRVAELGTHEDLMRKDGLYAALARAQGQRDTLTQKLVEEGALAPEEAK